MTGVLITREKFGHKHTQEECHVMTEAEMGEIFRSQEFQVLTATARSWVRRMKHTLPETRGYREQCGSCQREGAGWGEGGLIYDESLNSSVFHCQ